jgi:hypothetical protein
MNHIFDVAGITGAIVFSIAFGLYVDWLALRGLMRLMPARPVAVADIQNKAGERPRRATKAA